MKTLFIPAFVLIGLTSIALAGPGDLDPSFGEDGRVFFSVGSDYDIAATVLQQPDGKLVVGRGNGAQNDDFSVLRFTADGSPDNSFDGDGRTSLDAPGMKGTTRVVLLQADGKIVAAGTAKASGISTDGDFGLARYNADGSVDTSFGVDGVVTHSLGNWDSISSIIQQADGRLIAAGETDEGASASTDMAFVRFNTDGSLDQSFGENGVILVNFHESNGYDSVAWLVQHDEKLIATGRATPSNPFDHEAIPVVRLLPDGLPDPTFDGDGRVSIQLNDAFPGGNYAKAGSLTADENGRIVVVGNGNITVWDYGDDAPLIARVNSNGSADATFGDGGSAWLGLYGAHLQGLVIDPDGFLYVAGRYFNDHLVIRVTDDGELDTSFGFEGSAIIDAGDGNFGYIPGPASLVRQADGKIVTVSTTDTTWDEPAAAQIVIARLLVGKEAGHPGLLGFHGALSAKENEVIQFPVRRTGGSLGEVTVEYATDGGTATSDVDFTQSSGTLTWTDGDMADKTIEIRIEDDSFDEYSEHFVINLRNPTGGARLASGAEYVIIEGTASPPPSPPPPDPPPGRGGGGVVDWFSLTWMFAVLVLVHWRFLSRASHISA